MIIDRDLYRTVLINPVLHHSVDKLTIVSGYATASLLSSHRDDLRERHDAEPSIDLTIGMTSTEGIASAQHNAFKSLQGGNRQKIKCRYSIGNASVHAKVYVWSKGGSPILAFAGSANYTNAGFHRGDRIEAMVEVDAHSAYAFCEKVHYQTCSCTNKSIADVVELHDPRKALRSNFEVRRVGDQVHLPLIVRRTGETHERAGLNWGQRPEQNRDPNQAYIPIPSSIYGSDFFPPIGEQFVVQTDDGETMIFVRAQQSGKALHSPNSNSLIGSYFRRRLKVPSGERVTRADLDRYGRTSVTLKRTDEETYFLDFRPSATSQY